MPLHLRSLRRCPRKYPREWPVCRPAQLAAAGAAPVRTGLRPAGSAPQPATARPSRGGPGRAGRAARDRGNAGLGGERDTAIVCVSFRCFSFRFVSFRSLSFLPLVTGRQRVSRSHLAAVPAGDAPNEPAELFRTKFPGTGLLRAPAEPRGDAGGAAAPRRSPRLPDFCTGSGLPRRGERAHRGRGRGSLVRFFVVIKIPLPCRAWIGDEGRPPEPGAYAGQVSVPAPGLRGALPGASLVLLTSGGSTV